MAKDTFEQMFDIGRELMTLSMDQSFWSQATFGSDDMRGPIGPLKHIAKEAREAIEEYVNVTDGDPDGVEKSWEAYLTELADILILLLEVSRISGLTPLQLIRKAQAKMEVNKQRKWNVPQGDEPTEHVRDE